MRNDPWSRFSKDVNEKRVKMIIILDKNKCTKTNWEYSCSHGRKEERRALTNVGSRCNVQGWGGVGWGEGVFSRVTRTTIVKMTTD